MNLKLKLVIASIARLFGLFVLLQFSLLSLFPMVGLAQNAPSDSSKIICLSKHNVSETDISAFRSLTTELQPSVFIDNGRVNYLSAAPLCLFTDSTSPQNWPAELPVANIELFQIKFTSPEQLRNGIDLSILSTFPKLKFIHILSEIDVSPATIREILINVSQNAIVLFTIEKPS